MRPAVPSYRWAAPSGARARGIGITAAEQTRVVKHDGLGHAEAMDRIPIGKTPSQDEPDNVVHLRDPAPDDAGAAGEQEMSYEEAIAADLEEPRDEDERPDPSIPGSGVAGLLEQGVRVGAGLFSAGATAFADALRATMPGDQTKETEPDPATAVAGAGLGAAVIAAEAAASAATDAAGAVAPLISWVIDPKFARGAGDVAAGATRVLDGQWKAAQAETVQAASAFLAVLVPEIVKGVMDQMDLTALVRERVDVNAIVEDVDLDRIMDRVDVQRVIAKVDIDEVVDSVDIERIVERVDLTSIIDRLDLGAIAQEVIDDVDLPSIVRESSGALASEGVQTVRVQGMNADRLVSRIVDKVLRRDARDLDPPSEG
jgi:hypothetical protein